MKRHSLFHLWFAILVILSTSVCLASESYDNLHIYYTGNRITGVLEDADPVTTNGSMDYAGTTGRERAVEYNEWGAMTKDEARGITSITYDRLGNPSRVDFSSPNGSYASYVYSATGERLKATHYTKLQSLGEIEAANYLTDSERTGDNDENANNLETAFPPPLDFGDPLIVGVTKLEYHGPVIYRDGYVDMVRFPGGYATIIDGTVTFHYYTQDYLGNNRAVVNGSTGEIEQTVAYYPYGAVIADLGISTLNQPFKFGGKELTTQNGLNEYDFGARQYYPAVPSFTSVDPLCEKTPDLSPYLYYGNNPVNAVDPTGKVFETLWDIGNVIYDVGAAAYNHITGNHEQAVGHWIDAGLDVGAMLIPGIPAGVSKIGKAADKAIDAGSASKAVKNAAKGDIAKQGSKKATSVHGNSKASEKAQHLYEIYDRETGEVVKTGISSGKKTTNGKSYRANRQVNKWNKEAGKNKYDSEIKEEFCH